MKVVDAGALVAVLTGRIEPERFGDEDLIAPHLLDSEVLQVLRRLVRHGHLTEEQGRLAVGAFLSVEITRWQTNWLAARIWQYRDNLTAYDATYVALAEMTSATALLTTDARLANAPGIRCGTELL